MPSTLMEERFSDNIAFNPNSTTAFQYNKTVKFREKRSLCCVLINVLYNDKNHIAFLRESAWNIYYKIVFYWDT